MKFMMGLTCCSHWMGCIWGMSGTLFTEMDCSDPQNPSFTAGPDTGSWVRALYDDGGTGGPDNPCYSGDIYVASLYWSVMTITSIGYGDITPVRFEEYLLCVIFMLCGAISWA